MQIRLWSKSPIGRIFSRAEKKERKNPVLLTINGFVTTQFSRAFAGRDGLKPALTSDTNLIIVEPHNSAPAKKRKLHEIDVYFEYFSKD